MEGSDILAEAGIEVNMVDGATVVGLVVGNQQLIFRISLQIVVNRRAKVMVVEQEVVAGMIIEVKLKAL